MRAGTLDRRIDIERRSDTRDGHGQPLASWSAIVSREPAQLLPLRGEERFSAQQFIAREQVEFRVRWSQALASLNPLDRVVYPAVTPGSSPADVPGEDRLFDILAVHEMGRRRGLRIIAARRAEQRP